MLRRSFLKAIGLAPIAAPALAKMGVETSIVSEMAKDNLAGPGWAAPNTLPCAPTLMDEKDWLREELEGARRRLRDLTRDRELVLEERTGELLRMGAPRLDPDLAALKSFSASALLRCQARRNAEREMDWGTRSITNDIERWTAKLLKLGLTP